MAQTSGEAVKQLEAAQAQAEAAVRTLNDLIVEHEYQDVAILATKAAQALLNAAAAYLRSDDGAAFEAVDEAEDILDTLYNIVTGELDDEE